MGHLIFRSWCVLCLLRVGGGSQHSVVKDGARKTMQHT